MFRSSTISNVARADEGESLLVTFTKKSAFPGVVRKFPMSAVAAFVEGTPAEGAYAAVVCDYPVLIIRGAVVDNNEEWWIADDAVGSVHYVQLGFPDVDLVQTEPSDADEPEDEQEVDDAAAAGDHDDDPVFDNDDDGLPEYDGEEGGDDSDPDGLDDDSGLDGLDDGLPDYSDEPEPPRRSAQRNVNAGRQGAARKPVKPTKPTKPQRPAQRPAKKPAVAAKKGKGDVWSLGKKPRANRSRFSSF